MTNQSGAARRRRIGIFGGAFNPPHSGHLELAVRASRQLDLDEVLWVPNALSPHKENLDDDPGSSLRCEMVRAAIASTPSFSLSAVEVERGGKSYTFETIRELRQIYGGAELFFIAGADAFASVAGWRNCQELAREVTFAVHGRAASHSFEGNNFRSVSIAGENLPYSSEEVRNAAYHAESFVQLVPRPVMEVIQLNVLYAPSLPSRLKAHIAEVENAAGALAERWGLPEKPLRFAARFHDAYRALGERDLLFIIDRLGDSIDEYEKTSPVLLHGRIAAARIGRNGFVPGAGESPEVFREVVDAVRYHTGGRRGMSAIEEALFIADRIGKNWKFVDEIPADRREAMKEAYLFNLMTLSSRGETAHPRTIAGAGHYGAK